MAVLNLAITVPDAQLVRVQTALKGYYGVSTNAEAQEAIRKETVERMRSIVLYMESKESVASINKPDCT